MGSERGQTNRVVLDGSRTRIIKVPPGFFVLSFDLMLCISPLVHGLFTFARITVVASESLGNATTPTYIQSGNVVVVHPVGFNLRLKHFELFLLLQNLLLFRMYSAIVLIVASFVLLVSVFQAHDLLNQSPVG